MKKLFFILTLIAVASCSAEVIPASGRVFVYPRPAQPEDLVFGQAYTSARMTLVGVEGGVLEAAKDLRDIEWSVEGGRHGNTKEQVVVVSLLKDAKVVTAARVRFIVPWSGAKRLELVIPKDCGTALVPGTAECDPEKLTDQWVDVTTLGPWTAGGP